MNNKNENHNLIIENFPIIKNYKKNLKFTLIILFILLFVIVIFCSKIISSKSFAQNNKILINRLSALESELVKSQNITDMKQAEIFILKKELKTEQDRLNKQKLKQISKYLANEEMRGMGVEIIIKERENEISEKDQDEEFDDKVAEEKQIIHNEDLLRFVNFLWSKEAQGISINNIRLFANTNIICNGPVIRINESLITSPFVIKAIGKNINKEVVKKSPSVVSLELRGMEVSINEKEIILPKK